MFTILFWRAAGERAVRTAAQTAAASLGADAVDLLAVPWQTTLSVSAGAALVSLLMSVAASGVGPSGPGLTEEIARGGR